MAGSSFGHKSQEGEASDNHITMKISPKNVTVHQVESWGGMTVAVNEIPTGNDFAPLVERQKRIEADGDTKKGHGCFSFGMRKIDVDCKALTLHVTDNYFDYHENGEIIKRWLNYLPRILG